jgi:hypothetical protein
MSCRRVCTRASSGGLYVDPNALVPRGKPMSFQLAPLLAIAVVIWPIRAGAKADRSRASRGADSNPTIGTRKPGRNTGFQARVAMDWIVSTGRVL